MKKKKDIFDTFFSAHQMSMMFKIGYVPEDDELYELTPKQYEAFLNKAGRSRYYTDGKIYMVLPKDPKKYQEIAVDDVFVLTEMEIDFLKEAIEIVEEHCQESGKEFSNLDEKLRYCVSVMPESWSEGTKYENLKNMEPVARMPQN